MDCFELTPDGIGFEDDHHLVPKAQFDFFEIDGEVGSLADEAGITPAAAERALEWFRRQEHQDNIRQAADFLAKLFVRMVPASGKIKIQVLGTRLLALAWLMNRGGESLTSLAARAGISKQLADHHAKTLELELGGFHGVQQKNPNASAAYAAAAAASWAKLTPSERKARRRGKKKTAPSCPEAVPHQS